uniref:Uncharacterized protein n=1 Tax=Guillardia theta TaxID=55529 RepID=A0A6U6CFH1_GUITH|mmetsp:Transcript_4524/g.16534  ORF Transcript_4524/g.16534 Transcript_4524/m.16534 type:complete len:495 (+) Transcript_4524:149-1633(+)
MLPLLERSRMMCNPAYKHRNTFVAFVQFFLVCCCFLPQCNSFTNPSVWLTRSAIETSRSITSYYCKPRHLYARPRQRQTTSCRLVSESEDHMIGEQSEERKLIWRQIAKGWKDTGDQSNSKGVRVMISLLPRIAMLPKLQQSQLYMLVFEKLNMYARSRHYSEAAHSLSLCVFFHLTESNHQTPNQCTVWMVHCLFSPAISQSFSSKAVSELFSDLMRRTLRKSETRIQEEKMRMIHDMIHSDDQFLSALKYLHLLRASNIKHDVKTFNAISSSILEAFKQSSPADPLTVASQIFLVYSYMTAAEQQPDDVTWHHLLVACRLMGGENLSATETIKYFLKQYRKQGIRDRARCVQSFDITSFKSLYEALSPSKEQVKRQGKLYDYIKKFVRKVYGTSAFCAPFGSSVNGLVSCCFWVHFLSTLVTIRQRQEVTLTFYSGSVRLPKEEKKPSRTFENFSSLSRKAQASKRSHFSMLVLPSSSSTPRMVCRQTLPFS